jgi:hypothetical protein
MMQQAIDPDEVDRLALLLANLGEADTFEHAAEQLRTYRFQIAAGARACRHPAWQAAMVTAVNAGVRAMHGGVRVALAEDSLCELPVAGGESLAAVLSRYGADVVIELDAGVPTIAFDADVGSIEPAIHPFAGRWRAGVAPTGGVLDPCEASVPAATMAAAIAVSECFQRFRGFPVAGDRFAAVSLWSPDAPWDAAGAEGPDLRALPRDLWILGLGHLGQAYAWLLGLLPYAPAAPGSLVLQDDDVVSKSNHVTSMLHTTERLGRRKTRVVADAMERTGWDTTLIERRFDGAQLHRPGDPTVLLSGVDNPLARHLLDQAGFPVVVDAGLGAGSDAFLDMTVRRLPASRHSRDIWPARAQRRVVVPDTPAYVALETDTGDRCGVEQLAGRTVATAFVGVAAACWVVGGLLRELHGGRRYELVDYSLRNPGQVTAITAADQRPARVPTVPCA